MRKLVVEMVAGEPASVTDSDGKVRVVAGGYTRLSIDGTPVAWIEQAEMRFGLNKQQLVLHLTGGKEKVYDLVEGMATFEIE